MLEAVIAFDTTNNRGMDLCLRTSYAIGPFVVEWGMEMMLKRVAEAWEAINDELNPRGTSEALVKAWSADSGMRERASGFPNQPCFA